MLRKILKFIRSILRFAGKTIIALLSLMLLYLIAAILLTFVPVNSSSKQPETGITIYLKSNGIHTDLVLPIENRFYSWHDRILQEDFFPDTTRYKWVAFGWGDRAFYLDTPTWSDLKASTAINALFFSSPTAMHVTYYGNTIQENKRTRKVILTDEQYLVLCDYVVKSFEQNDEGNFVLINCCHYEGVNDNFYEAEGSYYLFNTCNNWTNSALKTAGVRTAIWAPFDKCILYHF